MASTYPGAYDTMLAPALTLAGPEQHEDIEIRQNDAIAAVQAELGINPAGSYSTLAARLASIETTLSGIGTPTWASFSPSFQGISALSSSAARYLHIGDIVWVIAAGTVSTTTSGEIGLTLPVTADATFVNLQGGWGTWQFWKSGGTRYSAWGMLSTTTLVVTRRAETTGGGTTGQWTPTSSTPTSWASGDQLSFSGFYQAA